MCYLQQGADPNFRFKIGLCLAPIKFGKLPEGQKLVIIDIGPVLLGEQISEHPELAGSCQNDRTMHVVVKPLLEAAAAEIISLSDGYLPDWRTMLF